METIYPFKYKPLTTEGLNLTEWFHGGTAPKDSGWYERCFSDVLFFHYWDGELWLANINGNLHWRQVGDYPTWRGLKEEYKTSNLAMAMILAEDFKQSQSKGMQDETRDNLKAFLAGFIKD